MQRFSVIRSWGWLHWSSTPLESVISQVMSKGDPYNLCLLTLTLIWKLTLNTKSPLHARELVFVYPLPLLTLSKGTLKKIIEHSSNLSKKFPSEMSIRKGDNKVIYYYMVVEQLLSVNCTILFDRWPVSVNLILWWV